MQLIKLSDIENLSRTELKSSKLDALEKLSKDEFEKALNSNSDPVTLSRTRPPYPIMDGRHRIYVARQRGYTEIKVDLT